MLEENIHNNTYSFPATRLRRCRTTDFIRNLTAESSLTKHDLVYPVFIVEGKNRKEPIPSMPDQYRVSLDNLLILASVCVELGVLAIALFPVIESQKDLLATESYNENGLIPRAVRLLKQNFPELGVFTDIALDPYTIHGQDGIIDDNGYVLNDITTDVLIKQALSHAQSGADFVCPSDMMDGRIGMIRRSLEQHNFFNCGIISYAAKYASTLYAPFRDAVGSMLNLQNASIQDHSKQNTNNKCSKFTKTAYQMNPANSDEALHEAMLDINEGADIIMVKPAISYLDIVYRLKQSFKKPVSVYHVSGEYAMLKFAANNSVIDYETTLLELMLCCKRAGANMIWTYAAIDIAKLL